MGGPRGETRFRGQLSAARTVAATPGLPCRCNCPAVVTRRPLPPDVISLRDYMDGTLRNYPGMLPEHIATGIVALIERMRPGDGMCHGDIHPDNVIGGAETYRLDHNGPRACRG